MLADLADIEIVERRAWDGAPLIVFIGPGGAGKSSVSKLLAPMLGRVLIDLDLEFCDRIAEIGAYIRTAGYEAYKQANSRLARDLVGGLSQPAVFTTSSGFLTHTPERLLAANEALVAQGYSISLLPHANRAAASDIIVERQLTRGFGMNAQDERQKIEARFDLYKFAGDMLVTSAAPPEQIASAIAARLVRQARISSSWPIVSSCARRL